jgi:predicted MFS family arabinose efflux permease
VEVGTAAAAATAPVLLGGPLGGALVDRVGLVRSSVLSDAVSGTSLALIPLLTALDALPFPVLLTIVFVSGLLDVPGETARRVLLPRLSQTAGIPLERSVGFLDATTRLSTMLGAPLAGVMVSTLGADAALLATAVSFAASAILTAALVRAPSTTPEGPEESSTGYWSDLREGLRFIRRDPLLRCIIALVLVTNTLDAARSSTLLPLYAERHLEGASSLGLVSGVFGAAALTGTLAFGLVAHRLPRRIPFAACFLVAATYGAAPALGLGVVGLAASAAVCGLAAGALNPILGAVFLDRIPTALQARVLGLVSAGTWAGMPLGGVLGGLAADTLGLRLTFAVTAVVYVVAAGTPLLGGAWRRMERSAS